MTLPPAPYPGLRAFRPEEALIFCGRAEHRAEVLDLLGSTRFLAVVGASGSGKSSLVLAGLLPDIHDGQLIGVDAESVRIVTLQPGLRPFDNLARELARELQTDLTLDALLRRGPLGLVQALDEVGNEPERALIIVVDQFEEIFRFADLSDEQLVSEDRSYAERPLLDGPDNEAQAFVNLLLQTTLQTRHLVYVLLTMRSEFLARCDQFTGLPEAISRSQFLTPRLNRQQLEQAIARPLQYYQAKIEPELINLILNEISTQQDQLPLMQHVLARMWIRHPAGAAEPITLTVQDYLAVGGLANALNNHGDSLCEELLSKHEIPEASIQRLFRALAFHPSPGVPPVRRPARLTQIAAETGLTVAEVRTIADVFRAEGCHLLMPPTTKVAELRDDSFLDISHESLLRQWKKLKGWLDAEWRQRRLAEELVRSKEDWEKNAPPVQGDIVRLFLRWREAGESVATRLYRDAQPLFGLAAPPNLPAWAKRYRIDWPALVAFCKQAFWWKRVTAVMSAMGAGLVILTLLLCVAIGWAIRQRRTAEESARVAMLAREEAKSEAGRAMQALTEATKAKAEAEQAKTVAVKNAEDAVGRLTSVQTDADVRNASFKELVSNVLKLEPARAGDVMALLDKPELRGLVQFAPVGQVPPVLGKTTALSAPVQFNITIPKTAPAPVVTFLQDGNRLLVLCGAKGVRTTGCWDISGEPKVAHSFPFETTKFISSPEFDRAVALGGDSSIRLIVSPEEVVSSEEVGEPVVNGRLDTIVLGAPLVFIFGTERGSVGMWATWGDSKPRLVPTGQPGIVNGVDFLKTPGGAVLLASGDDKWARLWRSTELPNLKSWDLAKSAISFPTAAPVRDATFDPSGRVVVLPIGLPIIQIWTVDPGSRLKPLELKHLDPVWFAKFSPDGTMLATSDNKGRVYLWDMEWLAAGRIPELFAQPPDPIILSGHRSKVNSLVWAPDSSYFATADGDGLAMVWQQPDARLRGAFNDLPYLLPSHRGGTTGLAISPDSRLVATVGADGLARVDPVRPMWRGKSRVWGGPGSRESQGGGGLALLEESDVAQYSSYFLPKSADGPKGLVARLNPKSFYLNARWNYSFTPRQTLRGIKALVRKAGSPSETLEAQPVDWGPPEKSGFDCDISQGLKDALDFQPGEPEEVEVELPLVPVEKRPATPRRPLPKEGNNAAAK